MSKDLVAEEREYLIRLLSKRHTELLHELHHAVTREYKAGLKQEIELTDRVKEKLEGK
jgi:hypothetical protein